MATYRFGGYALDTTAYRLHRGADPIALTGKPLDLLAYLAARPARLVTRDELFRDLWPGTAVTDNVLTQVVSDLRRALDDSPAAPRYLETVPRRGYRFIAPVEATDDSSAACAAAEARAVETSNLDALRSIFDGRLKLESLGAAEIDAAIVHFARAVELEPAFAEGYVGLANAKFWKYESTRCRFQPDGALLAAAIQDARQAVLLAPSFAEAQATLSYLLAASARWDDARAAAQRAVTLRPEFWGHHFRLGHASWGDEALRSLKRSVELYPAFAFAHFEMAIVHVARGALDVARGVLREGIAIQSRLDEGEHRFPSNGLHWLLGTIALSQGDTAGAVQECDLEAARAGRSLYGREFSAAALTLRGFAQLAAHDLDGAAATFRRSLDRDIEQVRPCIGLAQIARLCGRDTNASLASARHGVTQLHCGGRSTEALTMTAGVDVVEGREDRALVTFERLLGEPAPWAGWSISIDPLFAALRHLQAFQGIVHTVATRASSA